MNRLPYYQLCPKCNGNGHLASFDTPHGSMTLPTCDVCNGAKTIYHPNPETDKQNDEMIQLMEDIDFLIAHCTPDKDIGDEHQQHYESIIARWHETE